jgi:hypothetical protein
MTNKSYSLLGSLPFSALVFAAACGLSACAADEGDNNAQPPPGFTQDGAAVVGTGDAGITQPPVITTPDASTVIPRLDAGVTPPVVTGDTGVVVPMGDSGVVVPTADAAAPDAAVAMRPDQGMGDGKDVITIGDSWMNLDNSIGIQQSLEKISKRDYRNFGVPGTKLLDEVIPGQYTTAKMQGPVKTVIMTGGGNDVLQEILFDCLDSSFDSAPTCKNQIDRVAARLTTLWAEMAKDGVQDVLIVGYSNKTAPLALGSTAKSIAYTNMKIPPICDAVPAPLRCTAMDTDMLVPSLTIGFDGIHPTAAGYDALGTVVWDLMQKKGMRR